MKRILALLLLTLVAGAPSAFAGKYDLEILSGLANDTFKTVVHEAGTAIAYRGVAPGEPQGITGFDVGVEVSMVEIDTAKWDSVLGNDAPSSLPVPRLHARKGLPFGLDVGLSYAAVPDSNISVLGAELQYAILDGGVALPALAVRGSYSTLQGVDDLDLSTMGLDLVLSKGILMFTPYAGIGVVQINGEYAGDVSALKTSLKDQEFTDTRVFVGLQTSLALLRLTVDAEFGESTVYTGKISIGF